ncbi:MAG: hypothetical protein FKY71_12715 [Spiribacter salinus]|uniref:Uncharacterized protein n=1 Tax=Spiribacter salinus TaxID=1335746 RepID=A0A540VPE7_9GAMM|nr:MAG: hypothetical protein FKY71_12715 [Spiribacter salinus]
MKKYLILAIGILAGPANAEDPNKMEVCAEVSSMAEAAAKARYRGVPMRKIMEVVQVFDMEGVAEAIVLDAYDLPDYHTEGAQDGAVREFGNEIFSICYRGIPE